MDASEYKNKSCMGCQGKQQPKDALVDTWNKTRQGPRLIDTIQPLRENTEAGVKCIQKEVDWVKTDGKTSLASGRTIRYNVFGECKPFVPSIMQVFRDEGLVVEKAEDSHHDFKLSLPQ